MTAPASSATELLSVLRCRDEINAVSAALLGDANRFFGSVSLLTPTLDPPELGFLRLVAWLYVHYFETGVVGVRYVQRLVEGYGIDGGSMKAHVDTTRKLRTLLYHNIDPRSESGSATRADCEEWFATACGTKVPGHPGHWEACLLRHAGDARLSLTTVLTVLRNIEADDNCARILEDWQSRISRHHPAHTFDPIVSAAAIDMGKPSIDVAVRSRHLSRWQGALQTLDDSYDFQHEARRLIEGSLLKEAEPTLPITGQDVIRQFGLSPGPEVGRLLALAKAQYDLRPCTRAELLAALADTDESRPATQR